MIIISKDGNFKFEESDIGDAISRIQTIIDDRIYNVRNNMEYKYYEELEFDVNDGGRNLGIIKRNDDDKYEFYSQDILFAPNGRPSNLPKDLYYKVRSDEFKQWFGDWENDPHNSSKVLDINGEPLIVYHGSNANFNVFDRDKLGRVSGLREYFFCFSDNLNVAKLYASNQRSLGGGEHGNIISSFLNIRDMLEFDNAFMIYRKFEYNIGYKQSPLFDFVERLYYGENWNGEEPLIIVPSMVAPKIPKVSGFLIKNTIEHEEYKMEYLSNTYYVRDSSQIKHINSNNFNVNSDNIYESDSNNKIIAENIQEYTKDYIF